MFMNEIWSCCRQYVEILWIYMEVNHIPTKNKNPLSRLVSYIMGAHGGLIWLRHCATSRKVAGSISDGVIGIFH